MKLYNQQAANQHSFGLLFSGEAPKYLIIGTFLPTPRNWAFPFFYPNPTNKFWKILQAVFPNSVHQFSIKVSKHDSEAAQLKNVEDRKQFCVENKIAMTDMIATCYRMEGSSKDEQLLVKSYNDILAILTQYPSIDRLILTAKSLGASAHHHFYQYLAMQNIDFWLDVNEQLSIGKFEFRDKTYHVFSLASTSSRNTHVNDEELVELYKLAFFSRVID